MTVKDLTIDELKEIISETIEKEVKELQENTKTKNTYLTYDGLSEYLNISKAKIEKLKRDGKIPYVQIDGSIRFHKKQIDLWMLHNGTKQTFTKRDIQKYSNLIN